MEFHIISFQVGSTGNLFYQKKKSKHFYLPRRRGISEKWEECRIVPLPLITLDFFSKYKISKSVGKLSFSWVSFQRDKGHL